MNADHSIACGVFTNDDGRCTCKEDSSVAQRYTKQAEDARRAIDAGIAPRATPPAPVKSAANPSRRVTVLEGYYRSGDHECFCFDKWDGPDAYYKAFPYDTESSSEDFLAVTDAKIEAEKENRVYPDDLLPAGGYGKWTITVEFEPMEEPHAPDA